MTVIPVSFEMIKRLRSQIRQSGRDLTVSNAARELRELARLSNTGTGESLATFGVLLVTDSGENENPKSNRDDHQPQRRAPQESEDHTADHV